MSYSEELIKKSNRVIEGWSEEHGLLCVACGEPIQDNEYVTTVYKAKAHKGTVARFFSTEGMISARRRDFPLYAHLRCNEK